MADNVNFQELFDKLSEPLTCGVVIEGVRHQKSGGEWSEERIFVLSDQLHKDKPEVFMRTYFDSDGSWRKAIKRYVDCGRAFQHPKLQMFCIQRNFVTFRNLDFDLNFVKDKTTAHP